MMLLKLCPDYRRKTQRSLYLRSSPNVSGLITLAVGNGSGAAANKTTIKEEKMSITFKGYKITKETTYTIQQPNTQVSWKVGFSTLKEMKIYILRKEFERYDNSCTNTFKDRLNKYTEELIALCKEEEE
jgi:hypothetical protein